MLSSDPGDEGGSAGGERGVAALRGVEMSLGHPRGESKRAVSSSCLELRRSSGRDAHIPGSWRRWELRSGWDNKWFQGRVGKVHTQAGS